MAQGRPAAAAPARPPAAGDRSPPPAAARGRPHGRLEVGTAAFLPGGRGREYRVALRRGDGRHPPLAALHQLDVPVTSVTPMSSAPQITSLSSQPAQRPRQYGRRSTALRLHGATAVPPAISGRRRFGQSAGLRPRGLLALTGKAGCRVLRRPKALNSCCLRVRARATTLAPYVSLRWRAGPAPSVGMPCGAAESG